MIFPQACLFDLDGVLLDTENLHAQAWHSAAAFFGKELNKEELLALKGRTRVDCAKQITKTLPTTITLERFLEVHQPISKTLMKEAKAMPQAKELINWCISQNLPIALVTSSASDSVKKKEASQLWLKKISTRVHGDDPYLEEGKPSPQPYLLAAKRLKVKAEACWVIEDSQSGVQSGIAAGCKVYVLDIEQNFCNNILDSYKNKIRVINNLREIKEDLIRIKNVN